MIDLFGLDAVSPVLGKLQQHRTRTITAAAVNVVAADDGGGDVGFAAGEVVGPEDFAVLGPEADESPADEVNVMAHAAAFGDQGGGIGALGRSLWHP